MSVPRSRIARAGAGLLAAFALGLLASVGSNGVAWAAKDDLEPQVDTDFSTTPERAGGRRSEASAVRAVDAALSGKLALSRELGEASGDPVARKLVEWIYLKDGWRNAGYRRVMAFVQANPGWPMAETLAKQAETLLMLERGEASRTVAHFTGTRPATAEGRIALARAELLQGNTEKAKALVVEAWTDCDLSTTGYEVILSEFRPFVNQRAIETRVWKLVHAHEIRAALKTAALLSKEHVQAVQVAGALLRGEKGALGQYKGLSGAFRKEQALRYALARHHRRAEQYGLASEILLSASADHTKLYDPEAWWIERRLVVRGSLGHDNADRWRTAYKLAAAHGYSSGEHFCEGEFLAGWIALRMLKEPKAALKHFSRIAAGAPTRTEAARGHYWTGRAHAALRDNDKATAAYRKAAETPTLYYGQLARDALGLGKEPVPLSTTKASETARASVAGDELMRAFRLLADAGAERELGLFLRALAARFDTAGEASAAAAIVHKEGGAFMAVRFAKAAASNGVDIDDWAYPSKALPDWKRVGKPVEKAAVYGLTRQESEFNAGAVSHAGARGLMQLMPGTAKLVSRQHKLPFNAQALTSDPRYNLRLGSAHFADLVDKYDGSYVLTLVAYNAGPRRAREWIAKYGDPRSPGVDPIDWVESVPFTETRKYIQKVLQNVQVYRARLDPASSVPLSMDLARGSTRRVSGEAARSAEKSCGKEALSLGALIDNC